MRITLEWLKVGVLSLYVLQSTRIITPITSVAVSRSCSVLNYMSTRIVHFIPIRRMGIVTCFVLSNVAM